MADNRLPEVPVDDYDLNSLKLIDFRGLKYYVMPRYLEHYVAKNYEPFTLDLFLSDIGSDSVVVDVGAHFGAYSALAGTKIENGEIFAFEPVPENRAVLTKNIAANKTKASVTIKDNALSDKRQTATFNIPWASDSAGLYEHPNAATMRKIKVQLAPLDEFFAEHRVNVLKIDTEGNEVKVLEGAKRTIKRNPGLKMYIEFNPRCLEAAGYEPKTLLETIQKLGFRTYFIDEDQRQLIKLDEPENWEKALGGREYANLYCVPASFVDLFVTFHSSELGGAELATLELTKGLKDSRTVPHAILPSEGPIGERLRDMAIPYNVVPFVAWARTHKTGKTDLLNENYKNTRAIETIYRLIQAKKPDVVLSSTITVPWAAVAASAAGKPHVWVIHEFGDKDHRLTFDYEYSQVLKTINNLSQEVVTNTKAVSTHLQKVIPAKKITQTYYGLYLDREKINQPAAWPFSVAKESFKLILAGTITESKGQLDAVKAVGELVGKGQKVELLLIGHQVSRDYLQAIKDYIKEHNLEPHIKIKKFESNIFPYIKAADALLMCSANEAFGRVTAEAMLLQKPVIGANSGGTTELIKDGSNGLLYTPGDSRDLGRKIMRLMDNPALSKKIAENGHRYVAEHLDFDKYISVVQELLDKVKNNPQPMDMWFYEKIITTYAQITDDDNKKISKLNQAIEKLQNEKEQEGARLQEKNAELQDEINKLRNKLRKTAEYKLVHAAKKIARKKR